MPKPKLDPIDQIHKLCRENRIVPLLIQDEDFTEHYPDLKLKDTELDDLKSALYDALLNDFGNSIDQTLWDLGYNRENNNSDFCDAD
jgi:hypothetical protein